MRSELADEADLRLQLMAGPIPDRLLAAVCRPGMVVPAAADALAIAASALLTADGLR